MNHKNARLDLTAEFVRSILSYDKKTGLLHWKKTINSKAIAGRIAGKISRAGYIRLGIRYKRYQAHRLIWLIVTGQWPKYEIDHRDEVRSNNAWKNLRQATPSQNHRNRGLQKNNTTGYKGVCFAKRDKVYIAGIKLHGKRYNAGRFDTPEEAYVAYCKLAKKLHGKNWAKF